jgi:hypothetical protein
MWAPAARQAPVARQAPRASRWQLVPPPPCERSTVPYLPLAPTCSPFMIFPPVPFLPVAFPALSLPLCSPPSLTLHSSRFGPSSCPSCSRCARPCYSKSNSIVHHFYLLPTWYDLLCFSMILLMLPSFWWILPHGSDNGVLFFHLL